MYTINNNKLKTANVFHTIVLTIFFNSAYIVAQNKEPISDFYEYANKEWIDSTKIPENGVVVNNMGILWDKITVKSIYILSVDSNFNLDQNYQYLLSQLQNFYKSTTVVSENERERIMIVQKHFPMLFGILFSKITVTPDKEKRTKEIIKYLIKAYIEKIKSSGEIGEYYKELFLAKLDLMEFEIGALALSDFPKLPALSDNSLNENIELSKEYKIEKNKIKSDWNTPPHETDCYYNFYDNKVKIYAGTLFDFNERDDYAKLFATIGRTIAHEMTHAFDMVGRNFDQNGKKIKGKNSSLSSERQSSKANSNISKSLIKQFNQYSIRPGLYVNGKKTLQENYADLGGVEISILALKLYLQEKYPTYSDDNSTAALRKYFITYARFWREKATPEFEISSLKRIHTPQKFRAIGPIYNQDELYEIFEIDKNSKYYIPENHRLRIF